LEMVQNIVANSSKILIDIAVGITQHCKSFSFQIGVTFFIGDDTEPLIVLRAVKFNDKMKVGNVEIDDIRSDYFLPMDCYRKRFEKIIP